MSPTFAVEMLQVVVTVFMVGQPNITERLPGLYPSNNDRCEVRAAEIRALARDDVNVKVECVEADGWRTG